MRVHEEGRKRLLKLMLIQGVSQRDLATALGWESHTYLGRVLRGKVKTVTPEVAARLAHFFEVGMDDLFVAESSSGSRQTAKRGAA